MNSDQVAPQQYITDALNDPGLRQSFQDPEHMISRDKSQETVTSITGTTEPAPSMVDEVGQIAAARNEMDQAERELQTALMATGRPTRNIEQGAEVVFRSVFCKAGLNTPLVAFNYNRSRVILSGSGMDVAISEQPINPPFSIVNPPFNSVIIGVAATPFTRTVTSVRDLYAISVQDGYIGVQEEFFVS